MSTLQVIIENSCEKGDFWMLAINQQN